MHSLYLRFRSFALEERGRLLQSLRTAILVAALIVALLYFTQWLALRPGLIVLFLGQAGLIIAVRSRLHQFQKELDPAALDLNLTVWFEREQAFVQRVALFESAFQVIGFCLLGYAFWSSSGSLSIALAIGLLYPAVQIFGIRRRTTQNSLRRLRNAQEQLLSHS